MRITARFLIFMAAMGLAGQVHAASLKFEQTQRYLEVGQRLDFSFAKLPPAAPGSAFLFLETAAPLKGNPGIDVGTSIREFFDLVIADRIVGRYGCGSGKGIITIPNATDSITDCEFAFGLGLGRLGFDERTLFANGRLDIALAFSPEVGAADDGDAIRATLLYDAAAPAAVPLPRGASLGFGALLVLGALRLRRG